MFNDVPGVPEGAYDPNAEISQVRRDWGRRWRGLGVLHCHAPCRAALPARSTEGA
jgi:hypothetical protein